LLGGRVKVSTAIRSNTSTVHQRGQAAPTMAITSHAHRVVEDEEHYPAARWCRSVANDHRQINRKSLTERFS